MTLANASGATDPSGKEPPARPSGTPYAGPYTAGKVDQAPAKGTPAAAAAAPAPAACSLGRSGHSLFDEWSSCLKVTATLSKAPAVGEEAVLSYEVAADAARDDIRIEIELPPNLEFVQAPDLTVASGLASTGQSVVSEASRTIALAADQTQAAQVRVRATKAGTGQISVYATANTSYGSDGGGDNVFLTVGDVAAGSKFGIDVPAIGKTAEADPAAAAGSAAPSGGAKSAGTADLATPFSDDPPSAQAGILATACMTGGWFYVHSSGGTFPSRNFQVQAWDDDTFSGDDLLATGVTDASGNYSLCFEATGDSDPFGSRQDVYIRFVSENSLWRVRDNGNLFGNNNYVFDTGVVSDVPDGNTSFGNLQPGDGNLMRGLEAFDRINDLFFWIPSFCWDPGESPCRQVIVNWTPTSTDGTYYSRAGNDIHLAANDPIGTYTTVHEAGHALMDDNYNDAFPTPTGCGSPHFVQTAYAAICGWTEGFANWLPLPVYNTNTIVWPPGGGSLELDSPTWGTAGWDNGDQVEGRVAGALRDIDDSTPETWDAFGEGAPGNIWSTFTNNVSNTFADFWNQRAAGGFNVSSGGANASVYQNTIDYNYRNPLSNYVEETLPTPTPNVHNYSYNTTTGFWSAIAIRPPAGSDYDLNLYDDFGQGNFRDGSFFGGNVIDFVATDSNFGDEALGDFYPRAFLFSGPGGNYDVELAQGSDIVGPGLHLLFTGFGDVIMIRDVFESAGLPFAYRVVPPGGQDVELFLMAPSSADPIRSRGAAAAVSSGAGAGGAEQFLHTAGVSDWHGLVVTNKGGAGTSILYVDTSAPTGTVSINGGAASTRNPVVSLAISASDPETFLMDMRISTDGFFDTEPFVPYSTSASATVPSGDGLKTVLVQFRNNAGMTSATASDSILLDTTAPVTTASLAGTSTGCAGSFWGGVTVTLNVAEALTGVPNTRYRVDGGSYVNYAGPFVVSGVKLHTVNFQSTDGAGNVEALKTASFTIGPLLTTSSSGQPTKLVTLKGSAYQAGETVNVYYDGVLVDSAVASASTCAFSKRVTIPQSVRGVHTFTGTGATSGQTAAKTITIKPLVVVSPISGIQGAPVTANGYGFNAGEVVEFRWNNATSGTLLGSPVTNGVGSTGPLVFAVPALPGASYKVYGRGLTSLVNTLASFKIVPALTILPTSGPSGSAATVAGSGYNALQLVTVKWNCSSSGCSSTTVLGTATTDASGNFSGLAVTIPVAAANTYYVGGRSASGLFARTQFTITP